ncbi:MAG: DEAD/DEAH box helicase [Cellvibrionaceae bacterium]
MTDTPSATDFAGLGLPPLLLEAITKVGYETPSPIQAESIPILLEGKDLLGQAQTGTGKTAAFALPALSRLDVKNKNTQVLVLAPTRELAIQVAEACQSYAKGMRGFQVVPIYGGAGYANQLKQLRSGAQLVVGTPGRVMDHIRKKTLKLDNLQTLVLDEADEMLRMGFIDDVEWILDHTPPTRQVALFSATMPKEIQHVANRYLNEPHIIKIASKTSTAPSITQRYWAVGGGTHKMDALTRILEVEEIDAAIIFVRTKIATTEIAEKLQARGFSAEALNGDIAQAQREKTVEKMRRGKLDIIVATDVAARGIDIPRISHVINYDIPFDTEAYVHRIGRTGRAGRTGEAILFVANRERRMLKAIERATKQTIEVMNLPSEKDINAQRVEKFKQKIDAVMESDDLSFFRELLKEYQAGNQTPFEEIAAALAKMAQGDVPLLLPERTRFERTERHEREGRKGRDRSDRSRNERGRDERRSRNKRQSPGDTKAQPLKDFPDVEMKRFRLEVGYNNDVRPGHIVGAIANEAEIESSYIGHIEIFDDFSTVDLPAEMPKETFNHLKKVWVCQQQLNISVAGDSPAGNKKKAEGKNQKRRGNQSNDSRGGNKKSTGKKDSGKKEFAKKESRAKKSRSSEANIGPSESARRQGKLSLNRDN